MQLYNLRIPLVRCREINIYIYSRFRFFFLFSQIKWVVGPYFFPEIYDEEAISVSVLMVCCSRGWKGVVPYIFLNLHATEILSSNIIHLLCIKMLYFIGFFKKKNCKSIHNDC